MKFFKNLFKKKKYTKENKNKKLRNHTIYKLNKIKKNRFSKKTINETNLVFRIFLKKKFGIKPNLTNEEVIMEINGSKLKKKERDKINYIINTINEIEFGGKVQSKKINDNLTKNIKEIITEL